MEQQQPCFNLNLQDDNSVMLSMDYDGYTSDVAVVKNKTIIENVKCTQSLRRQYGVDVMAELKKQGFTTADKIISAVKKPQQLFEEIKVLCEKHFGWDGTYNVAKHCVHPYWLRMLIQADMEVNKTPRPKEFEYSRRDTSNWGHWAYNDAVTIRDNALHDMWRAQSHCGVHCGQERVFDSLYALLSREYWHCQKNAEWANAVPQGVKNITIWEVRDGDEVIYFGVRGIIKLGELSDTTENFRWVHIGNEKYHVSFYKGHDRNISVNSQMTLIKKAPVS